MECSILLLLLTLNSLSVVNKSEATFMRNFLNQPNLLGFNFIHYENRNEHTFCEVYKLKAEQLQNCVNLFPTMFFSNGYESESIDQTQITNYANASKDRGIPFHRAIPLLVELDTLYWPLSSAPKYIELAAGTEAMDNEFETDLTYDEYTMYNELMPLSTCIVKFRKNESNDFRNRMLDRYKFFQSDEFKNIQTKTKNKCTCPELEGIDDISNEYDKMNHKPDRKNAFRTAVCSNDLQFEWGTTQLDEVLENVQHVESDVTIRFLSNEGIQLLNAGWMRNGCQWSYREVIEFTQLTAETVDEIALDLAATAISQEISYKRVKYFESVLEDYFEPSKIIQDSFEPTKIIQCQLHILKVSEKISRTLPGLHYSQHWHRYIDLIGFFEHVRAVMLLLKGVLSNDLTDCNQNFVKYYKRIEESFFRSNYNYITIMLFVNTQLHLRGKDENRNVIQANNDDKTINNIVLDFKAIQEFEKDLYGFIEKNTPILHKWLSGNPMRYNKIRRESFYYVVHHEMIMVSLDNSEYTKACPGSFLKEFNTNQTKTIKHNKDSTYYYISSIDVDLEMPSMTVNWKPYTGTN